MSFPANPTNGQAVTVNAESFEFVVHKLRLEHLPLVLLLWYGKFCL